MALKKSKKTVEEVIEKPPCPLYGWYSIDDVAAELKNSIHSQLLQGQFIVAAKGDWELQRIVITRRLDYPDLFMMGVVCKGWTMFSPGYPKTAILDFIINDAKDKKVPAGIITDFTRIINNLN